MAYVIGLMSGTSLDGIDVALVDIQGKGYDSQVKLLDFMTLPFAQSVREEIVDSLSLDRSNVQLICSLNFKLGELFADAVEAICRRNQLDSTSVSVIGSHGQTIYHQPQSNRQYVASTLQIGEPAVIAYRTNTTVISNFRTMDMAAGGQGAPLVPYTELIMYRDQEKSRLLQNIGGIGNVTVIPKAAQLHDVYAFDTGPGNMIIDEICRVCFGTAYDKDGAWAAKGVVNEALLEQCMNIDYMQLTPPKSTGRELFGKQFVERIIRENTHLSPYDLLATMTMFTASSIAYHYKKFIFPTLQVDEVIIGGGGSYNKTLLSMLQQQLGNTCKVITQEDVGLSSEAKEAVAFALLAHETLHRLPSNVPTATGAREPVILGNVTYPPRSV
ncbi:anhydro-N-acetylmuramic acid kinase AnmK [Brevibacillus laterosporus]|uniref:anhydro-N-acetylmuramic acid kinase AnmK n=1 Tax=Brevibacillus laterosporus TaxID=1465 RepID=UPI000B9C4018|nr:anhydro-N-acetylmuramic acid kinase AnmK [Brevibacillus laterosporus]